MAFITTLARITVLEALRDRLLWLAAIVILAGTALAQFLHQVALTESREIQTAVLAAFLRVSAVFILSTIVIASMVREFNDKVVELLLSFPVPRSRYVFGKFLGYAFVAVFLAAVFALSLAFYARSRGVVAWGASLACELLIMTAVSVFCALSLTRTLSALAAVAGFYLLARSMSAIQIIAAASPVGETSLADRVVMQVVDFVALLLPGLDRMTETAWLLQAAPGTGTLAGLLVQTAIYVMVIGAAALFDFYRKNF
jgi:ABC-type transport system involved in multi-copper enzyme maturation permease subunit